MSVNFNNTEKRILREIFKNSEISQIDISNNLNMTSAAISQYTSKLIQQDIIQQKGNILTRAVGRNKIILGLNEKFGYVVGVTFEFYHIEFAIANCTGKYLIHKIEYGTAQKMDISWLKRLPVLFKEGLKELGLFPSQIVGVGITTPGTEMLASGQHEELSIINKLANKTKEYFEYEYRFLVAYGSNVHSIAYAEYMLNEFDDNFVCVKYGPRFGISFWINGKLFKGSHGFAGEIGHMQLPFVPKYNTTCDVCRKKGCLESMIAERYIRQIIKNIPNYTKEFFYLFEDTMTIDALKLHTIFKHAHKHEKLHSIMNHTIQCIATILSIVERIVDSKHIILFGESFLEDEFYQSVYETTIEMCKPISDITIVKAKVDPHYKVTGSIFLILMKIFYGEQEIDI